MPCPYGLCNGHGQIINDVDRSFSRCKCADFQQAKRTARFLRADVPRKYRDLAFHTPPISLMDQEMVKAAKVFADDLPANIEDGKGIWFCGGMGTGKTSVASVITNSAKQQGFTIAMYSFPGLLSAIKSTFSGNRADSPATAELVDAICNVQLLHIDDLGAERMSAWVAEQTFEIINRRYEDQRSTVLTTNLGPIELEQRIAQTLSVTTDSSGDQSISSFDEIAAGRIVSRLEEVSTVVYVNGSDYRRAVPMLTDAGQTRTTGEGLKPPPVWGQDPSGFHFGSNSGN